MKTLYSIYPKEQLQDLPVVSFNGRIEVVESESVADRAVKYLLTQPILGFDTETRPSFKKGHMNKVALLQVSSRDICFLFRLCHMGIPDCLIDLLTDKNIIKIGLSLKDDFMMLSKRRSFLPGTYVELQEMVAEYGIEDRSLQKIYANLFNEKISKSAQLSNWESDLLTEKQQLYAATDAWACIQIYEKLLTIDKRHLILTHIEYDENLLEKR